MKTIANYLLVLFTVVITVSTAAAQDFEYHYDNAGNRILRQVLVLKTNGNNGPDSSSSFNEDNLGAIETPYEENLKELDIKLYPNPTKGVIWVGISGNILPESVRITVYDMHGKLVYEQSHTSYPIPIDLTKEKPGNYMLTMRLGNEISRWQIVKM